MVWHRNSIGILIQRFFFSLVIMLSILTFKNCVGDSEEDLSTCLVHTGIPLVVILSIVTLKVSMPLLTDSCLILPIYRRKFSCFLALYD